MGSHDRPPTFGLLGGDVPKWLRERSAKPLFGGSNPPVTSNFFFDPRECDRFLVCVWRSAAWGLALVRSHVLKTANAHKGLDYHRKHTFERLGAKHMLVSSW